MPIVDQYGRPMRAKTLTQRVAEPGMTSVRQAFAQSVASGLTPQRLAGILTGANDGNIADYLVLAEEMEERDQHYASVLGIRKRAISGVEPTVTAASESAQDVKIADAVREKLAEHEGFADLIEDMLDALGKGFSQTELIWDRSKTEWWINEFVHRDPRFFQFDRETGREIRLVDEADMVDGVQLDPFKWISHRAKLKSGLTIRGGLARLVAFGWICKAYTVKDWMSFVELYGLPMRLGRYGPSATADDVDTLFRAVSNIGTDAAAVLPESMRIDFQEIAGGQGNDIFENFARWTDEQVSKAVLGQTMTSDNGSSMAQAEVHNEVRHDVAKADARGVTGTLNRDLVIPFVDLNFGPQDNYPRISIAIDEAEDVDMILQNADRMIGHGLTIKASELRAKLGFSEPGKGDDVIGGTPTPNTEELARNRAEPEAGGSTDVYTEVTSIEAAMLEDWEGTMGGVLGPILEMLQTAEGYEDAIAALAETFPDMDVSAVINTLVKGGVKARADGDAPD